MSQARPQNPIPVPPQAVDVEKAILGAMLIDGPAIGQALELLSGEDFYHESHRRIFAAIAGLYEKGQTADQLTLFEELKRHGDLDTVGGPAYVAELAAGVASSASIEQHANIVVDRALSRRLGEASVAISQRVAAGDTEARELLDWAEQQVYALSQDHLGAGPESIHQILDETFEQIEEARGRVSSVSGVDTGFTDLNDLTSGFQPGDLIILAARPSVGKTALSMAFACRAAIDHGVGVLVFSLEMTKVQVAQRLLCIQTRVDLKKLRTGRLMDDDWLHLTRNVGRLADATIHIDDASQLTVLEAKAKARRLQHEHGIGLIIVDYLQLMTSHESIQSREQEVARISRGLKGMAKDLNVPVLALSQLSRAVESRTDRRPTLSDLRESGSIEQDADVVMFIHRPDAQGLKSATGQGHEGVAEIIIAKQRNGPTDSAYLMWDAPSAAFENLAPGYRISDPEHEQ